MDDKKMDNITSLKECTKISQVSNFSQDSQEDDGTAIQDPNFSLNGYQVVRGEFFAHLFEPSVTLNKEKVSVNSACIRKLPKTDYVQFLVNPAEKKLAVKPCTEETRDSFRWSSTSSDNRVHPKSITCRIFFAKVMKLMGWDPRCRYKILGKLIRTKNDCLFVFDLTSAEMYKKKSSVAGERTSNRAIYPEDWSDQFGLSAKEHQDNVLIKIFDDYTVFKINKDEEKEAIINEPYKPTKSEQPDSSAENGTDNPDRADATDGASNSNESDDAGRTNEANEQD